MLELISRGESPRTGRPADFVEDVDLESVYAENDELLRSHRDLLLMLLFPMPAKQFLAKHRETASV